MDTVTPSKRSWRARKALAADVAEKLRERIRSGRYQSGTKLPSERILEDDLKVDRRTISAAVEILVAEGLVSHRPNCRPIVDFTPRLHEDIDRTLKSRLIALIMYHGGAGDYIGTAQQRVFWGMNRYLSTAGYHTISLDPSLCTGTDRNDAEREAELLSYALTTGFGGVVFFSRACCYNRELVQKVSNQLPLVLLDRSMAGVQADFVGSENCQSMFEATWHLIDKGHRRIAFATSGEFVNAVQERLNGYYRALKAAFPADAYEMILTPPVVNAGTWPELDAIGRLPARERPTAIVCVNNSEALRVAGYLSALNIRVPEDISIVGFDNLDRTLPNGVTLTSVAQPFEEIGKTAAELIIRRIQDPAASFAHVALPTKLIESESVMPLNNLI